MYAIRSYYAFTVNVPVPSTVELFRLITPSLSMVPPEKVLFPVRVRVLLPVLVMIRVPALLLMVPESVRVCPTSLATVFAPIFRLNELAGVSLSMVADIVPLLIPGKCRAIVFGF